MTLPLQRAASQVTNKQMLSINYQTYPTLNPNADSIAVSVVSAMFITTDHLFLVSFVMFQILMLVTNILHRLFNVSINAETRT